MLERPDRLADPGDRPAVLLETPPHEVRAVRHRAVPDEEAEVKVDRRDPEAAETGSRQPRNNRFGVFLNEIDEHLKRALTGPDQERDRMIFWLYFRQGMSTKEIALLPTIRLSAKGVGSVIERLKHGVRQQIVGLREPINGTPSDSDDGGGIESKANFLANSY